MSDTTSDERLMYDMLRFVLMSRASRAASNDSRVYKDTVNLARVANFALLAPSGMDASKELAAALVYRVCAPDSADDYVDSVARRHDNWWRLMGGSKWLTELDYEPTHPGFIRLCNEAPIWVLVAASCVITSLATRYEAVELEECLKMMTRLPGTLKMFLTEEFRTINHPSTL